MEIKFENNAAKQIYAWVQNRYLHELPDDPYEQSDGEDKVEELFSLATKSDGYNALSEAEARDVIDTLKQHDRKLRITLGIDNTLKEYRTRNDCLDRPETCEDYIESRPKSKYLPEAYFKLGNNYFYGEHDVNKSIAAFEKLISEFPHSIQAAEAIRYLIDIYNFKDDEERAFAYSNEWLKRPPYLLIGVYAPPPSYEEAKGDVLLFQAEYYKTRGNTDKAKKIYQLIVSGKGKEDERPKRLAKGALYELDGDPANKKYLAEYLEYKYSYLIGRAKYLLYERKDLQKAENICSEILSHASNLEGHEYLIRNAGMMLEEIKIRRTVHSAADALKAANDLIQNGKVNGFLEYQNRFSAQNDLPEKIYLQVLLLKLCADVEEIRIVNFTDQTSKVDQETKCPSPRNEYYVMFKGKGFWVLAESNDRWQTEDLNGLLKKLEKETGRKAYSAPVEGGSMLADSLRSFHNSFSFSLYEPLMALEKEKAKGTTPEKDVEKMFKSIKTKFNGGANNYKGLILSFAKFFSILPRAHFEKLESVSLVEKIIIDGRSAAGGYGSQKIEIIGVDNLQTLLHELTHHWDGVISVGNDGKNNTEGDPGLIYYKISWDDTNDWKKRPDAEKEDFASDYGMSNPGEDLPESAIPYMFGKGALSRKSVREQMKKGNFEPAAKYLFNKYIRSFDQKDGLCFEYNITPEDPPLSLAEVKRELIAWLQAHPNSVVQSTLTAIKEIEEEYARLKAKGGFK